MTPLSGASFEVAPFAQSADSKSSSFKMQASVAMERAHTLDDIMCWHLYWEYTSIHTAELTTQHYPQPRLKFLTP